MALRLGIGDTLTLCKGAIDLCSRGLHDEPEDAKLMVADMCLMRSHLQCLSKQMGDEKAFAASRPDIAPTIQRSLAPINRDLADMKKVLHECSGKRKPSLHIVERVRYHVLYKAKLDSFKEKMPAHRQSISEMETLIEAKTHGERRASMVRLGSFIDEHEEGRRKDEEDERELKSVLESLEENVVSDEEDIDPEDVLQRLSDGLTASGREKRKVDEHMSSVRDALFNVERKERAQLPELQQLEKFKF